MRYHAGMQGDFDPNEAKKFLKSREDQEKERNEILRKNLLKKTIKILTEEFKDTEVEVYLVGSLIRPLQFSDRSDIDVVLKNFHGDRFEIWTKLEAKIERNVEIILFEKCHFQEFVLKKGLKVCGKI